MRQRKTIMQTKSGWLYLTKAEQKAVRALLEHAERDMDYGDGGTYGNDNPHMERDIKQGQRGAEVVAWILETYCGKN